MSIKRHRLSTGKTDRIRSIQRMLQNLWLGRKDQWIYDQKISCLGGLFS